MVKICCTGDGNVGGPTMEIIAFKCPSIEVNFVDNSKSHIVAWNNDKLPLYELNLDDVLQQCRYKNLFFSTDVEKHVYESDVGLISDNTTTITRGLGAGSAANLMYLKSVAWMIYCRCLKIWQNCCREIICSCQNCRSYREKDHILSNPEFLALVIGSCHQTFPWQLWWCPFQWQVGVAFEGGAWA